MDQKMDYKRLNHEDQSSTEETEARKKRAAERGFENRKMLNRPEELSKAGIKTGVSQVQSRRGVMKKESSQFTQRLPKKKSYEAPKAEFGKKKEMLRKETRVDCVNDSIADPRILTYPQQKLGPSEADNKVSEFSFDKVLAFCRTKLESMRTNREELLQSIPNTKKWLSTSIKTKEGVDPDDQSKMTAEDRPTLVTKKPSQTREASQLKKQKQPKTSQNSNLSNSFINEILKEHAQMSMGSLKSNYNLRNFPFQEKPIVEQKTSPAESKKVDTVGPTPDKANECFKKIETKKSEEQKFVKNEQTKVDEMEQETKPEEDKGVSPTKESQREEVAMMATTAAKLITPFKDQTTPQRAESANSQWPRLEINTTPARSRSETILFNSMVESINKPRDDKCAFAKANSCKSSDQALKAKRSRSSELREFVTQAIKDHKIFCIFDNHSYIVKPVREELLSRGWLEVIPDRRLIPRKRPPPAGPTLDHRLSTDYAVEADLTAKENFADDVTDILSKLVSWKPGTEKPKIIRKSSDDSVKESLSRFRIVPPTSEKKSTNVEIREFVAKCKAEILRDKQKVGKDTKDKAGNDQIAQIANSIQAIIDNINGRKHGSQELDDKDAADDLCSSKDQSEKAKLTLTENELKTASKMIQSSNSKIHFMWLFIKPGIHLKCFNYSPEIVNKFQKTTFCTKIGLWSHLNNIQWYAHEVQFPAKSPRMYNTGEPDDLQAFFQDFQMTACIGILKWLTETFSDKGIKGIQKKKGKVPIKAFEFAVKQCERYVRFRENEDLNSVEEPKVMQEEWNMFLQWYYVITNDHGKLQETSFPQLLVVHSKAVEVLRAMKRHWPEIDIDGRLNIWIMKPYCASCGRGIFMTNNMSYIGQHSKYIVQKYIERPFLIYNTKFDIRQWFMITKLIPLEIWMYKECYLRFCTQPFALRNLHESVHLSNNSVQRKYVNQKDSSLPDQNIWDSNTFQHYLKTIGQPNVWNEIIYPGMRDAIISIMLASQDTFDSQRKSWFEVYGADFMISANLKDGPWLIEINENPAMDPSTKVTARLCPQMLRDVIKVVVDKRSNKNALTGEWELVYKQNYSPSFGAIDIDLKGKRIAKISTPIKIDRSSSNQPSPFFSSMKKNETKKEYEIVRGYYGKQGKRDSDPEKQRKARGKAILVKELQVNVSKNSVLTPEIGRIAGSRNDSKFVEVSLNSPPKGGKPKMNLGTRRDQ